MSQRNASALQITLVDPTIGELRPLQIVVQSLLHFSFGGGLTSVKRSAWLIRKIDDRFPSFGGFIEARHEGCIEFLGTARSTTQYCSSQATS